MRLMKKRIREHGTYLGRDDHLFTNSASFHPFTNEFFRGFILAMSEPMKLTLVCIYNTVSEDLLVTGGINEISTSLVESIEELETRFFIHGTKVPFAPFVANAHGSKGNWRHMETSSRC